MNDKPKVCEHGSLQRQCLTCELQEEIAALRAEVERLNTIIFDAAVASETVDHDDGTKELRKEAARANPYMWKTR